MGAPDTPSELSGPQQNLLGALFEHGPKQETVHVSAEEAAAILGVEPDMLTTHARAIGALEQSFVAHSDGAKLHYAAQGPYARGGASPETSAVYFAGTQPEGIVTIDQTQIHSSWTSGQIWVIAL